MTRLRRKREVVCAVIGWQPDLGALGLIAITPIGLEATIATGLLAKYGPQVGEKMAAKLVATAGSGGDREQRQAGDGVGVGGAMLAQFSQGLPSGGYRGGNVSGPVIQLQKQAE